MANAILKAHYDGKHIVLDEPFELMVNDPLIVMTIDTDIENAEWTAMVLIIVPATL